jgi:hypothetical protein
MLDRTLPPAGDVRMSPPEKMKFHNRFGGTGDRLESGGEACRP